MLKKIFSSTTGVISSLVLYSALTAGLLFSSSEIISIIKNQVDIKGDYSQPYLMPRKPWSVQSIDTQVISKHWQNVSEESIRNQVRLLKDLNINYVAIATPYNKPEEMKLWVKEIHNQGMKVWFRSHWNEWEGDNGAAATMSKEDYLIKTKAFILENPELFEEGDAFTFCVEPEQAGIGLGKKFVDWNEYKQFVKSQILIGNQAFKEIGMSGRVHTNWISVNGWIAMNVFDKELVDRMQIIVVDHFSNQSFAIGELENADDMANRMSEELDLIYQKWQKPILLGEWGYQIHQETSDDHQAEVIKKVYSRLKEKDYLLGINYWSHMGHHSRIIGDEYGDNLTYRKSAFILKEMYQDPLQAKLEKEKAEASLSAKTKTNKASK